MTALSEQVGGDHYKRMAEQPIELITATNCTFIQGCIIKYVSRYKNKNGREDIEKIIQNCSLGIELKDGLQVIGPIQYPRWSRRQTETALSRARLYAIKNNLSMLQGLIIETAFKLDYTTCAAYAAQLIDLEYGQEQKKVKNNNSMSD